LHVLRLMVYSETAKWKGGASATEIEEEFDVKSGTTRQHASRNGWPRHQPGAKKRE